MTCGRGSRFRSERPLTATESTSRSFPRSPRAWTSVSSTTTGCERIVRLPETTALCWHGYVPGIRPGQRYGFRVKGPWSPNDGLRCNPSKLLLDPYARAIHGDVKYEPAIFGHVIAPDGSPTDTANTDDSAALVPRSVVADPTFDWSGDSPPRIPLHETIIYELHVKGFTKLCEALPRNLRGTFAGLAHPHVIGHLQRLGVTAVELMPIHQFVHDGVLLDRGLRNYWGYNSIGYFAPHAEYASRHEPLEQIAEFREMVKALHRAGLEVLWDAAGTHTAVMKERGPTQCFRGLDARAYYRLSPAHPAYYTDYTGTGNSLNMRNPHVLQLIMDSLRYWVLDMHVDGFRFDLAATLARELHDVDRLSSFFDLIQQDPIVSQVKLIAEPWDIGEGGFQVGNFPPLWSEWNGKYRDSVRDFWRGTDQTLAEFAYRFTGSSDLYEGSSRKPYASINFITAHDGFTLHDLVSYNEKHNEANGEENRDGESHNRSWNCGMEGDTCDPAVKTLRARQTRNFLTTLLLSQGVPMILGGDEIGRSQRGNNNAYCQDNEVSWYDWAKADYKLLRFTSRLIQLRHHHPVFCRRRWFQGRLIHGTTVSDIGWFTPAGQEMSEEDWGVGFAKSLGVFLNGRAIPTTDERGDPVVDESFYVMFNAHHQALDFTLPEAKWGDEWGVVLDSNEDDPHYMREDDIGRSFRPGEVCKVQAWSLLLLRRTAWR